MRKDVGARTSAYAAKAPRTQESVGRPADEIATLGVGRTANRYEELEAAIKRVEQQIDEEVRDSADPFVSKGVELLETIPGVGERIAEAIVSEIGVDMSRFPSDQHLSSWAGMCPGNNESAGKRRSGKTTKGSVYLREALVQAGWAASHTKQTYAAAKYRRLAKRLGKKKALVAVGHTLLVMIYHVLAPQVSYRELGGDYFDKQNLETQRKRLIHRLEATGLKFTVEEVQNAA